MRFSRLLLIDFMALCSILGLNDLMRRIGVGLGGVFVFRKEYYDPSMIQVCLLHELIPRVKSF
jgi:uncharacterized RDD family membrane protein YckC